MPALAIFKIETPTSNSTLSFDFTPFLSVVVTNEPAFIVAVTLTISKICAVTPAPKPAETSPPKISFISLDNLSSPFFSVCDITIDLFFSLALNPNSSWKFTGISPTPYPACVSRSQLCVNSAKKVISKNQCTRPRRPTLKSLSSFRLPDK